MGRSLFRAPADGAGGGRGIPGMSGTATAFPSAKESERPLPAEIGGYRIVREIGHGGMGVVYEAEQPGTRQRVALKIILPGRASAEGRRRFEREAQALGRLQHAGIPRVFAAGSAGTGDAAQPYMVMEFVEGRSLREFARSTSTNAAQRLELCQRIAEALHHAHQKGVIHRDIKPENIVVNAAGQPIVLDFGLARMADDVPTAADPTTRAGQALGTYAYMSPEQAKCLPEEMDVRSDVYSLGVVAYELLSGQLPYDLRNKTLPEALDAIIHEDPIPLSRASSSAGLSAAALRGDAEIIVQKALEKEPGRRFQSADALAAEIRRHLAGEPLTIGRPSTLYRIQKFVRRYRGPVVATGAVMAALVIGLGVALWQAGEAQRQANEAKRQTELAQAAQAQTKRALVESRLQTLRLAMQRGSWVQVLEQLEGLQADGVALGIVDEVTLALARIEALDAIDQPAEATAAAERLLQRPDLREGTAAARLWLGELYLTSPDRRDEGLGLIRTALSGGLGVADREYAQAFVAATMPQAIAHLEAAVAEDPFHLRARGMLGVAYLFAGRIDDAAIVLDATSGLFPEDGATNLLMALSSTLRGDSVRSRRAIERLLSELPVDKREQVGALIAEANRLIELARRACNGDEPSQAELALRIAALLPLLQLQAQGEFGAELTQLVGRLRRRLLPAIDDSWGRLAQAGILGVARAALGHGGTYSDEEIEELRKAAQANPEAMILLVYATAAQSSFESAEAVQRDADAYFRAAAAPGIFRVQPFALSLGIAHQVLAYSRAGAGRSGVCAEAAARDHIRRLVVERIHMGPWQNEQEAFGLANMLSQYACFVDLAQYIATTGAERWPRNEALAALTKQLRAQSDTNGPGVQSAAGPTVVDVAGAAQTQPSGP